MPSDHLDLPAHLRVGQRHEETRIAEIAVILRNFVLEHKVITKSVGRKFGQEPVVLMSITMPVGQHQRWFEITFYGLEVILYIRALGREISVAEPQYLDMLLRNVLEKRRCAVPRLRRAQAGTAEDDPPHDQIGQLSGETQYRATAADLDVVGMGTQAKKL